MPRGDGTGPFGGDPGKGRGGGRGRMEGNRTGSGPGGSCVCSSCGAKAAHQVGVPCSSINCSKCGTKMVRG